MKAFEWFLESAKVGNHMAQYNTAYCYQYGEGINKDEKKGL